MFRARALTVLIYILWICPRMAPQYISYVNQNEDLIEISKPWKSYINSKRLNLTIIPNSKLIFARNTRPVGISSGDKHHRSAFYKMSLVFAWRSGSTPHLGQNYFWRRILMTPMTHFFYKIRIDELIKNWWNFSWNAAVIKPLQNKKSWMFVVTLAKW